MKKSIVFLFLFPLSVLAQFNSGTITFNDGKVISGLIKTPAYEEAKIKYKSSIDSKIEVFKVEDVKGFQIVNNKNITENYITLKVGNNKILSPKKFNIDKHKSFVKVVKQGKISVYSIHFGGNSVGGGNGRVSSTSYEADAYYLQRENEDFAFAIGIHRYDLNFMTGINLYAVAEINFEEICPEFATKLKEADLKATEFSKIVDIYEENCGKK